MISNPTPPKTPRSPKSCRDRCKPCDEPGCPLRYSWQGGFSSTEKNAKKRPLFHVLKPAGCTRRNHLNGLYVQLNQKYIRKYSSWKKSCKPVDIILTSYWSYCLRPVLAPSKRWLYGISKPSTICPNVAKPTKQRFASFVQLLVSF